MVGGRATAQHGRLAGEMRLAGYASANLGKVMVWTTADLSLLFLMTDLFGMSPGAAGTLLLVAMIANIAGDFVIGFWAARIGATARTYRRLLLWGTPLCALSFAGVYAVPALAINETALVALAVIVFRISYSLVDLPHATLLAHVSSDSRARGRAAGYRHFFTSLATLAVSAGLKPMIVGAMSGDASVLVVLIVAAAGVFALSLFTAWAATAQAEDADTRARPFESWRDLLARPPTAGYWLMVAITLITGFTLPMFSRMLVYRGAYLVGDPDYAGRILAFTVVGQLAGVAVWTLLLKRVEKTRLLVAAHGVVVIGCAISWWDVARWSEALGAATIGVGFAGAFMFIWGILADLVDHEQFHTRRRRDAVLFLGILAAQKLGAAISTTAIAAALAQSGFVAGQALGQTTRTVIDLLSFAVPGLGAAILAFLALRVPMRYRYHQALILRNARRIASGDEARSG